ncbi:hypothetical protein K435DRAFT_244859 [Dendrothele bispora CBS 962.96]|uniref:Uncharacterized protein n=1 Tax=Dendrothele bispora (strain CBS 962.96) TaxID=1314807 RepID=A0A4S8LNY3_DENBC|nr:hypothetical protein K435DRAFT_244859 [Dendrothele bispora CBS 962.96]
MELWRSPLEVIEDGCCMVCSMVYRCITPRFNPDNLVKVTSSPVTAHAALLHPVYFNHSQMQLQSVHPLFYPLPCQPLGFYSPGPLAHYTLFPRFTSHP